MEGRGKMAENKKSGSGAGARKKRHTAVRTGKPVSSSKTSASAKTGKTSTASVSGGFRKVTRLFRKLVGGSHVMLALKGLSAVAALLSLLMLVIAGADFRPSAILRGAKNKYAFTHASGDGFPVELSGGRILGVSGVTKGIAVLTSSRCTVYDGKGREVTVANHMFSSPAMKSADSYVLLYDSMGKDYVLRTLSGVMCKGTADNSILCADVSRSGNFAFVTTSETNNVRLVVCSSDGSVLHKWKSVTYKIADVALSPSGKYVAVCGYSTRDGVLYSTVVIQQVGGHANLREYSFENTLIADIQFDGNTHVAAVGDDLAAYLSVKNEQKKVYGYGGRILNCYDLNQDGDMALVLSEYSDGRNATVTVINDECTEKSVIATSMTSPYVDLDDGRINLLFQSEVCCYNFKGELLEQKTVEADCQSIVTSGGRLLARGVMYLNDIG